MSKLNHVKKAVLSIPPVKRIFEEKAQLFTTVNIQKHEIDRLNHVADKALDELHLLQGIVPGATEIRWPVFKNDLTSVGFEPGNTRRLKKVGPFIINWVLPPMGSTSGGHTSILRAIQYLESHGHSNRIYFYDALGSSNLKELKSNLAHYYPKVSASVFYNTKNMADCDAIFATNWFTAYPVQNYSKPARKYYFVQDFEPIFEPAGSYYTLAENTYKFGFHGITIGDWLKEKLSTEFGMICDSFSFGVSTEEYNLLNHKPRRDVLFYARPVTPRRGFEMGILALEMFHKSNPEIKIHMFGWDVGNFKINFPYENHGVLSTPDLNALYNKCAAGLVLSFTNMSLLPLEMLSSGCVPVVNDASNTRMVPYANHLSYAHPDPKSLALQLDRVVKQAQLDDVTNLAKAAKKYSWDSSFSTIEDVLVRDFSRKIN